MRGVCWLSAAAFVLGVCGSAVDGQCWELTDCDGFDSQDQIKECIWQCSLKQLVSSAESLLANVQRRDKEDEDEEERDKEEGENRPSLGILLSALSQSEVSPEQLPSVRPQRSGDRPTYSMEHFRWGKPMSRKRRPVKVHASVMADDEDPEDSMETSIPSLARRQLQSSDEQKKNTNTKSTTKYRITHFRWSAPPATKRYGGFMKSWSESSHKPLLKLLRNIIAKNRQ